MINKQTKKKKSQAILPSKKNQTLKRVNQLGVEFIQWKATQIMKTCGKRYGTLKSRRVHQTNTPIINLNFLFKSMTSSSKLRRTPPIKIRTC
jgi:hypothetical protein